MHYDFQSAGEFVYAKNADLEVQVRLEPSGGPDAPNGNVTYIEQTAIALGSDRLTFDFSRTDPFWLNGAPVVLGLGQFLPLAGGTVYDESGTYILVANTGEQVRMGAQWTNVYLAGHTDGVEGLLGNADGNTADDLKLPDGTVLQQPLSYDDLYKTFADAWRVTQQTSLFDYGPGQTTTTLTIPDFPPAPVTLSNLPQTLVQQAEQYVQGLGITGTAAQQDAALDYILGGGDATTTASNLVASQSQQATTTLTVTNPPTPEVLGIAGPVLPVSVSGTAQTVAFQVFLTKPSDSPVVVNYTVLDEGLAGQLGAADFGGTVPSGSITIAAGQTSGTITIAIPATLTYPVETLRVGISTSTPNVALANAKGGATLQSTVPVEGVDAVPAFYLVNDAGAMTHQGNAYTLDLGTIGGNGIPGLLLAIQNRTNYLGNVLGGSFEAVNGSGFRVTLPSSISGITASNISSIFTLTAGTALGAHSETITFDPTNSNSSGYAADLTPITLTITDTVVDPTVQPHAVPTSVDIISRTGEAFGNVVTVGNESPRGSDNLVVQATDTGGHVLPVQTEPLKPGASSNLSLNNPASTSGTFQDTLSLAYTSVGPSSSTALPGATVTLNGTVYQAAVPDILTETIDLGTVHQGDAGPSALISIANQVAAGDLSDDLLAFISAVSAGFVAGSQPVSIAPGQDGALSVALDTTRGGTFSGTATVTLVSHDVAQADETLGTEKVKLTGTVIADAVPAFAELSGHGTVSGSPGSGYVLELGTVVTGKPVDVTVGVTNAVTGPADTLSGTVTTLVDGVETQIGMFSGLAAGESSAGIALTLTPGTSDAIETITLHPVDSYVGMLPAETLSIVGDVVPCFAAGTLIATPGGEVPVERLAIGDLVTVQSGAVRPVKWLGRRSYAGRFLAGQTHILPVRIRAGALADGVPRRDLRVSPRHAMLVDGVLVPAYDLINDVSIVQDADAERIDYIHIELEDHDIVLAEGAASETFVDDDSRAMFHNAAEYAALYPDEAPRVVRFCAPRLEGGYALHAIWQRIAARAGIEEPAGACVGALRGYLDEVRAARVRGWAQDEASPEMPVCLDIVVDGVVVTQTLASRYRADLVAAGLGSGRHGFEVTLPEKLSRAQQRRVEVRRSADQAALPHSTPPCKVTRRGAA